MMKRFTLTLMAAAAMLMPATAQNKVKNVYTWQEKLNVDLLQDTKQSTQIVRSLFAGYNSICLPMQLTAEELQTAAKDVQIERLEAIRQEGDVLNLYFLDCTAEGMKAGVPYLIYSPTAQTMRAKSNGSFNAELQSVCLKDATGDNQVTFGSSWESLIVEGRYGIPAMQDSEMLQSILIRTEGDKQFLPTRCGFTWDVQSPTAHELRIKHVTSMQEGTTSIEALKMNNSIVDIYDLQGKLVSPQRRINSALNALPKGIYVVNGQKTAVQ